MRWIVGLFFFGVLFSASAAELKTRNVFLIMSDGLRWQEVFNGADPLLLTKEGGVKNTNNLARDFWRDTPEQRREALMPFLWNYAARHGQILGNLNKGSSFSISNGKNFSYPGYNEIFCGLADARIDSNDKKPNPNTNVFEWLNTRPGFRGKVSVFGTWNVFPYILNIERSKLPIWPPFEEHFQGSRAEVPNLFDQMVHDSTPVFETVIQDTIFFHAVMDHVKNERPRVAFIGFGETDEWAHAGRYDLYLRAAHRVDNYIRRLWETVQALRQYRDKTTFIITSDHGRGSGVEDWKHHGEKTVGSEANWVAVIGPDTPALGEGQQSNPYTTAQIASTIAALLGQDFTPVSPRSGAPIRDFLPK